MVNTHTAVRGGKPSLPVQEMLDYINIGDWERLREQWLLMDEDYTLIVVGTPGKY